MNGYLSCNFIDQKMLSYESNLLLVTLQKYQDQLVKASIFLPFMQIIIIVIIEIKVHIRLKILNNNISQILTSINQLFY